MNECKHKEIEYLYLGQVISSKEIDHDCDMIKYLQENGEMQILRLVCSDSKEEVVHCDKETTEGDE